MEGVLVPWLLQPLGDVDELDHGCTENNLNREEAGWIDVETAD